MDKLLKNNSIWALRAFINEFREEFNESREHAYEEIPAIETEEIERILERILEKHKIKRREG